MNHKLEDLQHMYSEVCAEEKQVAERKSAIKKQIEELLPQEPYELKTMDGTFKMVAQKKWKYSDDYTRAAEDLKIMKEDEQESGQATFSTVYTLRFNPTRS